MKILTLLITSTLVFLASTNHAEEITWDFNSSNGGWTPAVESGSPSAAEQWQWSPAGGVWNVAGTAIESIMTLTSPVVTVDIDGPFTLTIHHRFNFEPLFDGGHFRTRTDSGAWIATTNTNVSGTQYNLNGVDGLPDAPEVFTSQSLGYSDQDFVTSIVDLGDLTSGQTVELQFRAGWDILDVESAPNWEVDMVSVTNAVPEPQSGALVVAGLTCFMILRGWLARRRRADQV